MRWLVLLLLGAPAEADTVVAARTLRAEAIIGPQDISLVSQDIPGGFGSLDKVIGLETRVVVYAGRPVRPGDVGPPAIIDRNQVVSVVYDTGAMRIMAEGRALGRAGVGDRIRVMNLASHSVISGLVLADGRVSVSPARHAVPAKNEN